MYSEWSAPIMTCGPVSTTSLFGITQYGCHPDGLSIKVFIDFQLCSQIREHNWKSIKTFIDNPSGWQPYWVIPKSEVVDTGPQVIIGADHSEYIRELISRLNLEPHQQLYVSKAADSYQVY